MKTLSRFVVAAGFVALAAGAAFAQQPAATPTPAAIAVARELLALKHADGMFNAAVPGMVQRTKDAMLQNNLNYQKDLNEVAVSIAQSQNGREREIGQLMAQIYASDFTEQELKDLVVFYKTPLGQKLLKQEPLAIQASIAAMNQWAQKFGEEVDGMFRVEMRKRGKPL